VFLARRPQPAVNTAVMLLMDASSSMGPNGGTATSRITLARQALLATALALESVPGVAVACAAFPAFSASVAPLTLFDQTVRATGGNYAVKPQGSTPLAEALWWVAQQLAFRPEPRKLVVVMTDGAPNDVNATVDIVRRMISAGMEFVPVGIQTMANAGLFERHAVIDRLEELAPALFRLLGQSLIREP
jgi:nitric oxide reductase activation protein